jgi:FkbM family methyltransferase
MSYRSLWRALARQFAPQFPSGSQRLFDIRELARTERERNEAVIRGLCSNAYLGNNTALCRVLGRYSMFVDTNDLGFSSHMLLSGFWEMWVTETMVARVRPGMHVVDCGANLGYFTLVMSDLVGAAGHVDAFEPNPAIAERLGKTIELNGFLDRTTMHQAALSRSNGDAVLQVPPREPKNAYMCAVPLRPEDLSVTIPTQRLDALANADRIDLIKIDVEGAEEDVWAGMQGILDQRRPLAVILEFASDRYVDPPGFLDEILSHGFAVEWIDYVLGPVPTTRDDILRRPGNIDQMLVFTR